MNKYELHSNPKGVANQICCDSESFNQRDFTGRNENTEYKTGLILRGDEAGCMEIT